MTQKIETWKIIVGGVSSLVLTMGIARFALTPLLPAMQDATGLGDDGAGLLAGVNYAGYLSGALIGSRLKDPVLKQLYFRIGIILAVLTTIAMSFTDNMILWSAFRYISGLTSAAGMVICTSLVLDHLKKRSQDDLIGVHFGGVGMGVAISAVVLTFTIPMQGWSESWLFVGIVGLIFAIPCFLWIKADGLSPVVVQEGQCVSLKQGRIMSLLISYVFAGATFSIGTTFIISIMSQSPALSDSRNIAWIMVGVALAPSCYLWVRLAGRFGDIRALNAAYLIQALGCALPVLYPHPVTAIIGGLLFGGTFMGIVSVVLALGGKIAAHNPSSLIGILVVAYGVGQIVGPVIVGFVMDQTGFSELGLWAAAACSLVSIIFMGMMALSSRTDDEIVEAQSVATKS